jgi:hypothetical protein
VNNIHAYISGWWGSQDWQWFSTVCHWHDHAFIWCIGPDFAVQSWGVCFAKTEFALHWPQRELLVAMRKTTYIYIYKYCKYVSVFFSKNIYIYYASWGKDRFYRNAEGPLRSHLKQIFLALWSAVPRMPFLAKQGFQIPKLMIWLYIYHI